MLLQRPLWRAAAIVIVCLFGTNVSFVAAQSHTPGTSQLAGWVYIDRNNDGQLAFNTDPNPEYVIPNVTISLYSQTGPETFLMSTQTDLFGRYFFNNLLPGTYGLKQTQPIEFIDGIDTLGQLFSLSAAPVPPGASAGTAANNAFNNIVLTPNVRGDYYLFGELGLGPGYASKRFLQGYEPDLEFGFEVPEPATVWLVLAAAGIGLSRRRRRRD